MEHNSDSSNSGLDYADIGCRVREARVEYGLTQEELAEDVGVDAKHISRIGNGYKQGYVRTYCQGTVDLICDWIMGKYDVTPEALAEVFENCLPVPLRSYLL